MQVITLTEQEANEITVGEAITLSAVLAVVAVAVVAVVVYKLFLSKKGSANFGGWKFTWN